MDLWKQQCLDLDVVVKEGHLMLQQQSSGQAVAFDEKLGNLNVEWHTVIQVGKRKSKVKVKCGKTLRKHGWYFMPFVSNWILRVIFE